jgi:hypothetical protein
VRILGFLARNAFGYDGDRQSVMLMTIVTNFEIVNMADEPFILNSDNDFLTRVSLIIYLDVLIEINLHRPLSLLIEISIRRFPLSVLSTSASETCCLSSRLCKSRTEIPV